MPETAIIEYVLYCDFFDSGQVCDHDYAVSALLSHQTPAIRHQPPDSVVLHQFTGVAHCSVSDSAAAEEPGNLHYPFIVI